MKKIIMLGGFVGSTFFGSIPMLWGDDFFSMTSIVLGFAGTLVGFYAGFKFAQFMS